MSGRWRSTWRATRPVAVPAVAVIAVLLALAPRYGFHRDELYFIANADHPAWGYVDHGPVTPMLGWLSQQIFGDSVFGLRVFPALLAAAVVIVAAALATEIGGDRTSVAVTAWATASTSTVLAFGHMLTTPMVDVLIWTTAIWVLCRIVRTGDQRWFVLLGAILGIGLLNKFTVLLAVAAFGAAIVLLPGRRILLSRWTAVGVVAALAIWAPNLWWQASHGWPILELSAGVSEGSTENRLMAVPFQALFIGPPVAVGVAVGFWRQLRGRAPHATRFVSVGFVILIGLLIVTAGKPYYAAGALPAVTAVAVVALSDWIRRHPRAVTTVIAINGAATAVLVLPVLPVAIFVHSPIPAVYSEPVEMIGWPQFVDRIADEYQRIDDGSHTAVILTRNYGEAGAIDRFGPTHGLPPAYSGHNSYADFRQPPDSTGPVLTVGFRNPSDFFLECEPLDPMVMPYGVDNEEQGAPLSSCVAPRRPWKDLWPDIRRIS